MKKSRGCIGIPKQENIEFEQAAPVSTTWYTVADLKNVDLEQLSFAVRDTGETIEMRITMDDLAAETISQSAVANTLYNLYKVTSAHLATPTAGLVVSTTSYYYTRNWFGKFRSVLIEIRKTTANGAGDLQVAGYYKQY